MSHPSWNERYASGDPLPWDTGTPDPLLVDMIESRLIPPGRTLEVGCGSTEGPPRDAGPQRRTARDLVNAIEPHLELVELRSAEFGVNDEQLKAWRCLSRKRTAPAQPSTRRS